MKNSYMTLRLIDLDLLFQCIVFSFSIDSEKQKIKKINGNPTDDNMSLLQCHYNVFKNNVMTLLPFHVKAEYLLLWVKIN